MEGSEDVLAELDLPARRLPAALWGPDEKNPPIGALDDAGDCEKMTRRGLYWIKRKGKREVMVGREGLEPPKAARAA